MKAKLSVIGAFAALFALFSFVSPAKKTEVFKVDITKSSVVWTAKKVTGQHTGSINISNGQLTMVGDVLKGGNFAIDMTSITNKDLEGEWRDKLIGHLKSDDFFSVDKNPLTKFEITAINANAQNGTTIEGNLTIKGITHPISFPASISKKNNVVVAIATIRVDRTKYDIKYGSKSFIQGIGDKAIDDEFDIQVNLVAIK